MHYYLRITSPPVTLAIIHTTAHHTPPPVQFGMETVFPYMVRTTTSSSGKHEKKGTTFTTIGKARLGCRIFDFSRKCWRLNPESRKKGEPFCQLCFIKGLKRDADGFALADVLLGYFSQREE